MSHRWLAVIEMDNLDELFDGLTFNFSQEIELFMIIQWKNQLWKIESGSDISKKMQCFNKDW